MKREVDLEGWSWNTPFRLTETERLRCAFSAFDGKRLRRAPHEPPSARLILGPSGSGLTTCGYADHVRRDKLQNTAFVGYFEHGALQSIHAYHLRLKNLQRFTTDPMDQGSRRRFQETVDHFLADAYRIRLQTLNVAIGEKWDIVIDTSRSLGALTDLLKILGRNGYTTSASFYWASAECAERRLDHRAKNFGRPGPTDLNAIVAERVMAMKTFTIALKPVQAFTFFTNNQDGKSPRKLFAIEKGRFTAEENDDPVKIRDHLAKAFTRDVETVCAGGGFDASFRASFLETAYTEVMRALRDPKLFPEQSSRPNNPRQHPEQRRTRLNP